RWVRGRIEFRPCVWWRSLGIQGTRHVAQHLYTFTPDARPQVLDRLTALVLNGHARSTTSGQGPSSGVPMPTETCAHANPPSMSSIRSIETISTAKPPFMEAPKAPHT